MALSQQAVCREHIADGVGGAKAVKELNATSKSPLSFTVNIEVGRISKAEPQRYSPVVDRTLYIKSTTGSPPMLSLPLRLEVARRECGMLPSMNAACTWS